MNFKVCEHVKSGETKGNKVLGYGEGNLVLVDKLRELYFCFE